jgi:hypothetical protein
MKIFIVGKQCSGKTDVLDACEELGLKVGREFCNIKSNVLHIDPKYESYNIDDIDKIFESGAYICITGIDESGVLDGYMGYRGLSLYTFDNSDIMLLHPQQVCAINKKAITDKVVFVWLDNNRDNRIHHYAEKKCMHDFIEIEDIESQFDADFIKTIYNFPNSKLLYFNNEDPERVAAIVYALVKHPELLDIFANKFT